YVDPGQHLGHVAPPEPAQDPEHQGGQVEVEAGGPPGTRQEADGLDHGLTLFSVVGVLPDDQGSPAVVGLVLYVVLEEAPDLEPVRELEGEGRVGEIT